MPHRASCAIVHASWNRPSGARRNLERTFWLDRRGFAGKDCRTRRVRV